MKLLWIAMAAVFLAVASGQAGTITLETSGDWSAASNWNSNTVPGSADIAVIRNSLTGTITRAGKDVYRLIVASGNGGQQGTLNMTAGTLAVSNNFILIKSDSARSIITPARMCKKNTSLSIFSMRVIS